MQIIISIFLKQILHTNTKNQICRLGIVHTKFIGLLSSDAGVTSGKQ